MVRFQRMVKALQDRVRPVPVITAALAWLRHFMPYAAAGMVRKGWVTLIGQGCGILAYPDAVIDLAHHGVMDRKKCCTTCSMCSQIMKDGVGRSGCVVRDRDIYAAELKKGRQAAVASADAKEKTV